jgi:hypothetical protein
MTKDLLPNRSLVRRKIADVRDLKTKIELLREDWQKDDLNRQYLELVKVICIGLGALTTRFHSLSATVILPIQALELLADLEMDIRLLLPKPQTLAMSGS